MKEMCSPCYGTGQIRCLRCGGSGVEANSNLLDDCLKCKGSRKERCLLCRGRGFIGGHAPQEQIHESQVQQSLPVARELSMEIHSGPSESTHVIR